MTIKRHGRCTVCGRPTTDKKQFAATIDMFNPDANRISSDVADQIVQWRKSEIYCTSHKSNSKE